MAAVGALGGAAWGALIGHIKKSDDWRPVGIDALRVTVAPTRGRGIAVGVNLGF